MRQILETLVIVNFTQLQCLVGVFRNTLATVGKYKHENPFDDHFMKY